jgi:antitoxin HicB
MGLKNGKRQDESRYSNFDEYLRGHSVDGEVDIAVEKRLVALQIENERKARKLTKVQLAALVGTSRAQLDRVLDPSSQNVTIETLKRVALAMGKRLHIELVDP